MGTVKTVERLARVRMNETTRVTLGYALFGLVVGLFLLPWVYLAAVRTGSFQVQNTTGPVILFAIVFGLAIVLGFVGRSRAGRAPA